MMERVVSCKFHFDRSVGLPPYVNEEKEFCIEFDENDTADPEAGKQSFDAAHEEGHLQVGLRLTSRPVMERDGSIVRWKFKGVIEPQ